MKIQVLDHGYVELIEPWGTGRGGVAYDPDPHAQRGTLEHALSATAARAADYEVGIVEAARQSTQGSFRGWEEDAKLLKHLYNNNHATPFEFAGMVIEVQAPIFVFREWHRHRTQSYNEMSARYAPLPDLYYVPTVERVMRDGGKNKQAQGTGAVLTTDDAEQYINALGGFEGLYYQAEWAYKLALERGIPKELARVIMPVGHYSRMRAATNLRNWLAFMTLRCDPLAQWEIQQFAHAVSDIIKEVFPRTHGLWHAQTHREG